MASCIYIIIYSDVVGYSFFLLYRLGRFRSCVERVISLLVHLRDGVVNDAGNAGDEVGILGVGFVRVFHENNQIAQPAVGEIDEGCIVVGYRQSVDLSRTAGFVPHCNPGR